MTTLMDPDKRLILCLAVHLSFLTVTATLTANDAALRRLLVFNEVVINPANYSRLYCNESQHRSLHLKQGTRGNSLVAFGRFLTVVQLPEQLTKSRKHLAELMLIAKLTNRTLVLPQCRAGHLANGLYCDRPICNYFNVRKMGEFVNWVTEEYFLQKLDDHLFSRRQMPSIHSIFFKNAFERCSSEALPLKFAVPRRASPRHKLTMAVLDKQTYRCSDSCHVPNGLPDPMTYVLEKEADDADVLVIAKSASRSCFDLKGLEYVTYSNKLVRHANNFIKTKLGPRFLSIHFRVEKMLRLPSFHDKFKKCASLLIVSAHQMMAKHNYTGVFLASDITPQNVIHSTSMVGLDNRTRSSLAFIFESIHSVLEPVTWNHFNPVVASLDSGVQGILDKLVCSKGHMFLYPPNECFGLEDTDNIPSSFTVEVVEMREAAGVDQALTRPWGLDRL